MKHKIRKITTTMLATICAFSSVAAISASAASSTRYAEMSNGLQYHQRLHIPVTQLVEKEVLLMADRVQ